MNKHRSRMELEIEQARLHKRSANRTSLLGIVLCVVMGIVVSGLNGGFNKSETLPQEAQPLAVGTPKPSSKPAVAASKATPEPISDEWKLLVVNRDQKLSEDFTLNTEKIGTEKVDKRILRALTVMLEESEAVGIELTVCSGYRSVKDQTSLYESKLESWLATGMSKKDAVKETEKYLQPPGASEHHTGLAVDFLTGDYKELDSGFAETNAYRWLKSHAAEYGFIERYPENKEEITGVLWEPWHYRYVGAENAQRIGAANQCLEEYTTQNKK